MSNRIEHRDYLAAKAITVAYTEQENQGSGIPALAHLAYVIAREHCHAVQLATLEDVRQAVADGEPDVQDALYTACERFSYTLDADAYLLGSPNPAAYWDTFREVAPSSEQAAIYALEADMREKWAEELDKIGK